MLLSFFFFYYLQFKVHFNQHEGNAFHFALPTPAIVNGSSVLLTCIHTPHKIYHAKPKFLLLHPSPQDGSIFSYVPILPSIFNKYC